MIRRLKILLIVLSGLFILEGFGKSVNAEDDFPARPKPEKLVNDFAGLLTARQSDYLNQKLSHFAMQTSTQIAVVTVNDLKGYDVSDYAFRLGEQWGIGQKGKDNGIMILVKPKRPDEKGKVFIAVGYGLESVVPDVVAKQVIIENEILPWFRRNDVYTGLDRATNVLISLTSGEFTSEQYVAAINSKKGKRRVGGGGIGGLLFFIFIFMLLSRGRRGYHTVGRGPSLLSTFLLMNLMGSRHRGMWDDFSGSSGHFGGGGGFSDFGGFGGGSFGGGGAGGEW